MYGLPPGEYYISASLRNTDIMMMDRRDARAAVVRRLRLDAVLGIRADLLPGHDDAGNAQRVTVAVGQEAQNTDFALAPVRLARDHRHAS